LVKNRNNNGARRFGARILGAKITQLLTFNGYNGDNLKINNGNALFYVAKIKFYKK